MTEGTGNNGPTSGNEKDGKRIFKFVFNMSKKTEDNTEMTADFVGDVQHFHDYDEASTKCFQHLEACYLPNPNKNQKDEDDAFLKLASALNEFKKEVPTNLSSIYEQLAINMKAASKCRKHHQKEQKYQLRHLRRFHLDYYQKFLQQRDLFDESRRRMDQAKADVRNAKTTVQIEKKAICYQMAVDDFDAQTELLIKLIDGLPRIKQINCRDVLMVLMKHRAYHSDVAQFFKL